MSSLPIRLRVAAAFAVAMAAVLAASGFFLYTRLDAHLASTLDRELRLRAQDLETLVGTPSLSLRHDSAGRFVPSDETYAELLDLRGRVLDTTRSLVGVSLLSPAELAAATKRTIFADRRSVPGLDEPSRLLATTIRRQGRRLVLVVGTTGQNRIDTLARFREELLIAGPIALILATAAGYLLAGLSLRQVDLMRRRAAAISADTPGERLPVLQTGDELERLGQTLNAMLDRLETALQRERDLVADAGHELRTPLALLRTELELALRHARSPEELKEAIRWSSNEADRLSQLAEALLLLASSDRGELPLRLEQLEAADLFASVSSRFEWRSHQRGTSIVAEAAPGLSLQGDRIRLEQALANLVDNALRYGNGPVHLAATSRNGHLELHVTDEGAGFPPEFLAHAFDRFTRADPARSRGGAGLGLSIVRTIATAHRGSAEATNRPDHGADVWLTIPTSPSVAQPEG